MPMKRAKPTGSDAWQVMLVQAASSRQTVWIFSQTLPGFGTSRLKSLFDEPP